MDRSRQLCRRPSVGAESWGAGASWEVVADNGPDEASMLTLDSTKALNQLGRSDRLAFEEAIEWTMRWSKEVGAGRDHWDVAQKQALHLRIVLARIPFAERDRRRLVGGQATLPGSAIGDHLVHSTRTGGW